MARWHEKLFPVLEELNIGFVAFSPLANGFLSGKYGKGAQFDGALDYRSAMPQFTEKGVEQNSDLLSLLNRFSEEKNAAPAQISLAWMMCRKPYIVPIPGSRRTDRQKENAAAADIVLTDSEIARIDRALDSMEMSPVFGGSKVIKK